MLEKFEWLRRHDQIDPAIDSSVSDYVEEGVEGEGGRRR
jgi:hypothetical protein